MSFENWIAAVGIWGVDRTALRKLYDRGLTPEQANQHMAEYPLATDDTGWQHQMRPKRMGRPLIEHDRRRVLWKLCVAMIKACDTIPGSQIHSVELRQQVFEFRDSLIAIGDALNPHAVAVPSEQWLQNLWAGVHRGSAAAAKVSEK